MKNSTLRIFAFTALALCALIGATHGLLAAAICWLAFEFAIARPLPGCGSNVLGTLAATQIIIQEALDLVFTERPILNEISLDLSNSAAKQGQAVVSRILAIPAVENFGSSADERADTDVSVTINNFKEVKYTFTAAEYNQTDRNLVRESARPLAIAVANHLVDAVAALWTSGNYSNATTLANGWDYNHLVTVRQAMVTRGMPEGQRRFYVANAAVYAQLLQDPMVVAAQNNPGNAGAIGSGRLPMVAGFGLAEYPALPTTGNLVAFAGTKDSAVLAARVPTDPRSLFTDVPYNGTFNVITNEKTGLSVVSNQYIDQATWDCTTRLVFCYGVAKGNASNGERVITS